MPHSNGLAPSRAAHSKCGLGMEAVVGLEGQQLRPSENYSPKSRKTEEHIFMEATAVISVRFEKEMEINVYV